MHKLSILLIGMLLVCTHALAQKPFEGRIFYSVKYLSFPDGSEGVELALPQQMTLLVDGSSYRMQQSSALAGDLVWMHPAGSDTVYRQFEFMDRTVCIAETPEKNPNRFRVVEKPEEKAIAGANCQRVFLQSASGGHFEAWVNPKWKNPLIYEFPSLQSMPLQFEWLRNGIRMRFTTQKVVEEPLDETYFQPSSNCVRMRDQDLHKIMN